ncbi:MAG: TspO/MBR family protein [Pseudomonadota bacterium]
MDLNEGLALAGFGGACFLTACSGAFFRPGPWYEDLRKPGWNPPNWLFGPAWTVLFIMIAVSGWLVWKQVGLAGGALVFTVYGVQLVLNFIWSGLFFGLKRMDLAFAELVLLWLAIAANIIVFWPISETAAWLLVPYLAWVSFAGVLNFTIWRLNARKSAA